MKRSVTTTKRGADALQHIVRLEGDQHPLGDFAALATLVRAVADQPELIRYVAQCPESVKVQKVRGVWVVEAVSCELVNESEEAPE